MNPPYHRDRPEPPADDPSDKWTWLADLLKAPTPLAYDVERVIVESARKLAAPETPKEPD